MKRIVITTLTLMILVSAMQAQVQNHNLMPVPQKIEWASGTFKINDQFKIAINGNFDDRLCRASSRILQRLAGRTGFFFSQPYITRKDSSRDAALIIEVDRPGKVELYEDESYELVVGKAGISLKAGTDIGALRGLETFLQLLDIGADGYYVPFVTIRDNPRFPWRGLMIDGCRHFMPVDMIKRNLDGMAAVKLNVMHWHLSEDQGFRVESEVYPKLHQLGSDGFYYTQAQIRDIISYAADRGIRVMPEFDLPGHATSWLVAFPELASAPGPYQIERQWGIFDPTFNPTIEETYSFLDKFFAEMSQLFGDEYMHIGGDENNGKQWDANPDIQKFMKEKNIPDNHTLQAYFNQRLLEILTRHGKKMVGWEEILHPDMPKNIVIQSWRGEESLTKAAEMGYQVMLSRGYYIDLIQPTDYHYLNDPNPSSLPLTEEQRKMIIGGEATMWAEFVSPETVDSRIWPRTAAIAERLWSQADVRDIPDMYRRLEDVSFHLEELGLTHEKNYPMMLRRLTNNNNIVPLKNLIDVIEPVKIYNRNRLRAQFQHSPLTRVVDAARPDQKVAREFNNLVAQYISSGSGKEEYASNIKKWLVLWQNNHSDLVILIRKSPVLQEIEELSQDLSKAATIGLDALTYILNEEKPGAEWVADAQKKIKMAREPRAQSEIMVLAGIESLLNHAAGSE